MNAMVYDTDTCNVDALNALLRDEMSAVETYTQAMGQFDDQLVIADLQKIRDEHSRAVRELRDLVIRFGGAPANGSGTWGSFAPLVTGAVRALGPATVLAALRQGEEHGINEYTAALENGDIHAECMRVIRADLISACQRHIDELNRLLGGMDH